MIADPNENDREPPSPLETRLLFYGALAAIGVVLALVSCCPGGA